MSNMGRITQTLGDAGTEVTVGALNVIKASGKGMTIVADGSTDLLSNTVNTASGLVKNLGATAVATLGTVATVTERVENSTKEAAQRRADIEKTKTSNLKDKNEAEIAKSKADTKVELLRIQNLYEIQQEEIKREQEAKLAKLNAVSTQYLLDQTENIKNQQMAYYYGFKQNNSKVPGFEKSVNPFNRIITNWCYSYIPEYFVTEKGEFIDIKYPEQMPNGLRPLTIMAKDKNIKKDKDNDNDNYNDIIIDFEMKMQKKWGGKIVAERVPIIKYVAKPDQNPIDGQMYYRLLWFVCPAEYRRGGKKRKTNKTHKKRKANRRRTAARRHSRR